uniref:Uncharacterized protein n=1 Tax=Anguilla anguilla TaxID=7936 RepID=A0A0E9WCZ8_ANGAN
MGKIFVWGEKHKGGQLYGWNEIGMCSKKD